MPLFAWLSRETIWPVVIGTACFMASLLFGQPARAEDSELQLIGKYSERFDNRPQVLGNLLVGLSWVRASDDLTERPDPNFSLPDLAVELPVKFRSRRVCVKITSEDGRYTSQNLYDIPPGSSLAPKVGNHSKYGTTDFAALADEYVAVVGRITKDCQDPGEEAIVPSIDKRIEVSKPTRLIAFVNSKPEQISVHLMADGKPVESPFRCGDAGADLKSRVAFAAVCQADLPGLITTGTYQLEIDIHERFKTLPNLFTVALTAP